LISFFAPFFNFYLSEEIHLFSINKTFNYNCLMAFLPGHPGKAGTRKAEPLWILMKQEMMGW